MIKFVTDATTGDYICLTEAQILRIVKAGEESYVSYTAPGRESAKRTNFTSFSILQAGVDYS